MGPRKKPVVSPQPTKGSLSTYTRREPLHHDDNVGYDEDDDDDIDHTKDDNDLVGPEEEEENTSLEEFDEVEVKGIDCWLHPPPYRGRHGNDDDAGYYVDESMLLLPQEMKDRLTGWKRIHVDGTLMDIPMSYDDTTGVHHQQQLLLQQPSTDILSVKDQLLLNHDVMMTAKEKEEDGKVVTVPESCILSRMQYYTRKAHLEDIGCQMHHHHQQSSSSSSSISIWLASNISLVARHEEYIQEGCFLWELIHPQINLNDIEKRSEVEGSSSTTTTPHTSSSSSFGYPIYNPNGRYIVKLYYEDRWRRIEIDDLMPMTSTTTLTTTSSLSSNPPSHLMLPRAHDGGLWPAILCKALLKLASISGYNGDNLMMEFDVISALTGWCRRTHLSSNRTLSQELSTEIASHSLFLSIDHIPLDVGQGKRRRRKSDTEVVVPCRWSVHRVEDINIHDDDNSSSKCYTLIQLAKLHSNMRPIGSVSGSLSRARRVLIDGDDDSEVEEEEEEEEEDILSHGDSVISNASSNSSHTPSHYSSSDESYPTCTPSSSSSSLLDGSSIPIDPRQLSILDERHRGSSIMKWRELKDDEGCWMDITAIEGCSSYSVYSPYVITANHTITGTQKDEGILSQQHNYMEVSIDSQEDGVWLIAQLVSSSSSSRHTTEEMSKERSLVISSFLSQPSSSDKSLTTPTSALHPILQLDDDKPYGVYWMDRINKDHATSSSSYCRSTLHLHASHHLQHLRICLMKAYDGGGGYTHNNNNDSVLYGTIQFHTDVKRAAAAAIASYHHSHHSADDDDDPREDTTPLVLLLNMNTPTPSPRVGYHCLSRTVIHQSSEGTYMRIFIDGDIIPPSIGMYITCYKILHPSQPTLLPSECIFDLLPLLPHHDYLIPPHGTYMFIIDTFDSIQHLKCIRVYGALGMSSSSSNSQQQQQLLNDESSSSGDDSEVVITHRMVWKEEGVTPKPPHYVILRERITLIPHNATTTSNNNNLLVSIGIQYYTPQWYTATAATATAASCRRIRGRLLVQRPPPPPSSTAAAAAVADPHDDSNVEAYGTLNVWRQCIDIITEVWADQEEEKKKKKGHHHYHRPTTTIRLPYLNLSPGVVYIIECCLDGDSLSHYSDSLPSQGYWTLAAHWVGHAATGVEDDTVLEIGRDTMQEDLEALCRDRWALGNPDRAQKAATSRKTYHDCIVNNISKITTPRGCSMMSMEDPHHSDRRVRAFLYDTVQHMVTSCEDAYRVDPLDTSRRVILDKELHRDVDNDMGIWDVMMREELRQCYTNTNIDHPIKLNTIIKSNTIGIISEESGPTRGDIRHFMKKRIQCVEEVKKYLLPSTNDQLSLDDVMIRLRELVEDGKRMNVLRIEPETFDKACRKLSLFELIHTVCKVSSTEGGIDDSTDLAQLADHFNKAEELIDSLITAGVYIDEDKVKEVLANAEKEILKVTDPWLYDDREEDCP